MNATRRTEVEALLARTPLTETSSRSAEEILHELQVHQIELEMQNEELRDARINLEESRDRYVDLYDFAPNGYLTLNQDGKILEINLTGATLLGVERSKLLHRFFASFVAQEDRGRWFLKMSQALKCEDKLDCELTVQRSDGSSIYAKLNCLRLSRCAQESVRIMLTDISEQKQAEEVLRKSLEEVEDLYNKAACGYHSLDKEGIVRRMNDTELAWMGYTRDEVIGKMKWTEFQPPDGVQHDPESFPQLMEMGIINDIECELTRKDGTVFMGLLNATAIYDPMGNFVMNRSTLVDITQRKQAEQALHQSNLNLTAILDNSPYMIWLKDNDGRYIEVNNVFAHYAHLETQKQIIGKTDYELWSTELAEKYRANDMEVMAARQQQRRFEEQAFDGTKLHWVETFKSAVIDGNGNVAGTSGFSRDISERKAAEQQLQNLAIYLQNVREEEKASIARELHDDLGGTMNALKITIHQLNSELSENNDARILHEQVEIMSQMINDAAGITRNIISGLRPTILDDFGLLAAIEWQTAQFHKLTGIEYLVNCIGDKGNLDKLHSIAIFRILQEALTNVTKHSGASRVEIEYHHSDSEVLLTVSDNGQGLSEVGADKFGAFGMIGMKERAKQRGGSIRFDTPPNGGLCIMVAFPILDNSCIA